MIASALAVWYNDILKPVTAPGSGASRCRSARQSCVPPMRQALISVSQRLWPDFDALPLRDRLLLLAELAGVLYSLPLAILSAAWLLAVTDFGSLSVLLIAVLMASYLARRLSQAAILAQQRSREVKQSVDVYQRTLAHQKVAQELAFAGQIQASFLPESLLQVPGWQLTATFHLHSFAVPDDGVETSSHLARMLDFCYFGARLWYSNFKSIWRLNFMTSGNGYKGTIGILTGGGDVPGLNPAIRAVTIRALREGYRVIGLRRGWAGVMSIIREKDYENRENYELLTEERVNKAGRTGGTFLHTSRTRPSRVRKADVPPHLQDVYTDEMNDLTPEVMKNLEWLGIDYMIPIGGDDTLSYGVHLYQQGFKVIAIPKTMDNDVPGTDYCIGFSTCISRTIQLVNTLRTSAGSHERFLVVEVFGRYAGYTAMLPTMAGAANRCVIPEHKFDIDLLTELLAGDRYRNPSKYSIVLVSEGAMFPGGEMVFQDQTTDAYGHKKLGGIGDLVSQELKTRSAQFNDGKPINVINQRLGYLVRGGDPDAIDSIVPMAYGNLALDLILTGIHGRLVVLKNGRYDDVPLEVVTSSKKVVDVEKYYNRERLRPHYRRFAMKPLFIMTSELE